MKNSTLSNFTEAVADELPGIVFRFTLHDETEWKFEFLEGDYSSLTRLGITPQQIMKDSTAVLKLLPLEAQVCLNTSLYLSAETMTPFKWLGEFRSKQDICWLQFNATPYKRDDGCICWSGLALDVTAEKKQQLETGQLNLQGETDFLTGLKNRRKFISVVETELQKFKHHSTQCCIAIINMDWFKKINELYGRPTGDKVLQQFSQLLSENLREGDVAARIGRDKFAILLPNTSKEQGFSVCSKIIAAKKHFVDQAHDFTYSCSIGLSQVKKDDDLASFYKRADDLMYQAKEAGRNRLEM